MRDPRTDRILAGVISPFYGPKLFFAEDPNGEWEQAKGVALPEGGDEALERIWVIVPGEADGVLYAGGDPGVLFKSTDGGADLGARAIALRAPDAPRLDAGRRRAVPALDRALAGRAGQARARAVGRRRVADRRRRRDLAPRQQGPRRALPARGVAGGDARALRPRPPARAEAPRAPVHPVPRRRLPLRRRRRDLDRDRRRAAVGLRLPARRRPRRPRQRLRDPAQGRHGPRHARGPRARLRDPRRGRDAGRRAATGCPPSTPT